MKNIDNKNQLKAGDVGKTWLFFYTGYEFLFDTNIKSGNIGSSNINKPIHRR